MDALSVAMQQLAQTSGYNSAQMSVSMMKQAQKTNQATLDLVSQAVDSAKAENGSKGQNLNILA